ncbi:MAG: glycosyltransferase [Phycisphaerales bacterium]|nr:glycosyltransferase [Phycisphaerales bacterium]
MTTATPADSPVLVSLAAVTWDFRLVGRTRMLTEAWLAAGEPTCFVQVPSLRTGWERLRDRLRGAALPHVVRPWPTFPARWWQRIGARGVGAAARAAGRELRRQLERKLDLRAAVALVVTPGWEPWLDMLPFGRVVYDCIDDLAVHVPRKELAPQFAAWERALVARSSGGVVVAERLGTRLRAQRPELPLATIRNGVDAALFAERAAALPRPVDVPADRSVVGFVGALYEWIDWEMIRVVAHALPDVAFVLIGPEDGRGSPHVLASLPNVHLLGPRPYAQVPAYMAAFTAGWVPFLQDEIGAAANPVKIYEYFAVGCPVVTTPVADTELFGDLAVVVRTPEEAVAALRTVLLEGAARASERRAFARANDWSVRAREYVAFVRTIGKGSA